MSKRKSLSFDDNNDKCNSNKRGCTKRKALFVNTDKYRNKQSTLNDVSFDFPSSSSGTGNPSQLPKESTPLPSRCAVPKLVVRRRRTKGRHLNWPNVSEIKHPLEEGKRSNAEKRTANESVKSPIQDCTQKFEVEERIDGSDILTAETVLSSRTHNLGTSAYSNTVASPHEVVEKSPNLLGSTASDDSLVNCLLTLNDPSDELLGNSENRGNEVHDDSLMNCLLELNSPDNNFKTEVPQDAHTANKISKHFDNDSLTRPSLNNPRHETTREKIKIEVKKHTEVTTGTAPQTVSSLDGFYGLPSHVQDLFIKHRNISTFYPWQDECLRLKAVHEHRNLVYSLPTSSGKTLVAEILILKEIILLKKNAIFVLPYVSIVQEKVRGLAPFAIDLNFHIEEYAASKGPIPPKKRRKKKSIYIATIEKANAILNSLLESERSDQLGAIVVDELHMIGEGGGRGALLEILLTKVMFKCPWVQIVGMSATLGNIEEIQKFLNCELYTSAFRPVKLEEYVKMGDSLYAVGEDIPQKVTRRSKNNSFLTLLRPFHHSENLDPLLSAKDPDHLTSLVLEVLPEHSCLIFCATKKHCENVAALISKVLPPHFQESKKEEKETLLRVIEKAVNGVCSVLQSTIPSGVAYHHGGLTVDEREVIEEAYRAGVISVLCCTSTLASGVNLPARRVILRSPYVGRDFITQSQYKQMIGRAGRAGIDSSGESVLIVQKKDLERCKMLLGCPVLVCRSSLFYKDGKGVRELFLSLIGLKICASIEEILSFVSLTLYCIQQNAEDRNRRRAWVNTAVLELIKLGLLKESNPEDTTLTLQVTSLGMAALKASIDVDLASQVYGQLKKASEALVLTHQLHLLYLLTPLDNLMEVHIDWMNFYKQTNRFCDSDSQMLHYVGISQDVLCRKATGQRLSKSSNFNEFVYKRFYLTLMIDAMLKKRNELWDVVHEFNQSRGFLQSLFTSTLTFTLSMVYFTEHLEDMWMFKALFQALSTRINEARYVELAELMELPGVKRGRAMQLFHSGYKGLRDLVHVDPLKLMRDIDHLSRKQAEMIVYSAKMILEEKVEALRDEADEMAAIPDVVVPDMPIASDTI